ncbi:hypothetical protein ACWTU6_19795 [Mesorhizobium sp. BHbsci]
MPVCFIHGVNVRKDDPSYDRDVAARDELIRSLLLKRLAQRNPRYGGLKIINPYWGGLGVTHAWGQATVPNVSLLEDLGAAQSYFQSDLEMTMLLKEQSGRASGLEPLGAVDPIAAAARRDVQALLEAVLAPLIYSEEPLIDRGPTPDAEAHGALEGMLLAAAQDIVADSAVVAEVQAAPSGDAALDLLRDHLDQRFTKRASLAGKPADAGASTNLEELGPSWLTGAKDRIQQLFDRAKSKAGRALSAGTLDAYRARLHAQIGRFLGDVFVYLQHRGDRASPGPIPKLVLNELHKARKSGEPLVLITHSMGGNILFDLLTTFDPALEVDAWISVGGQVGQFEEMKLFLASDRALGPPAKVKPFGGRVKTWLNVYDPVDVLSFLVAPVFESADPRFAIKDLKFKSGASTLEAHGAYLKRPSFYTLLGKELEQRV